MTPTATTTLSVRVPAFPVCESWPDISPYAPSRRTSLLAVRLQVGADDNRAKNVRQRAGAIVNRTWMQKYALSAIDQRTNYAPARPASGPRFHVFSSLRRDGNRTEITQCDMKALTPKG
jgi:hypothetical protein